MPKPNFLIVGAPKSGTTSLYFHLRQHPQVFMSAVKEPHFFTFEGDDLKALIEDGKARPDREVTDWHSYLRLFDSVSDERAIGEASTSYLGSPKAVDGISRRLPNAKFIAILRNPVDRLYSDFVMHARKDPQAPRSRSSWQHMLEHGGLEIFGKSLRSGRYARYLKRYYDTFDRDQVRVYLFEDLKADRDALLGNLFDFLDVAPFRPGGPKAYNVGGFHRSHSILSILEKPNPARFLARKLLPQPTRMLIGQWIRRANLIAPPPLPASLRAQLVAHYRDDILSLQDLIDRDLTEWLR